MQSINNGAFMTTPFFLPDLGEGVHEAEILAVPIIVGQDIVEGDIILEIETDKAAVEIPSPFTGTVSEILVQVDDMSVVGDVLVQFSMESTSTKSTQVEKTDKRKRVVPASPSTRRLARELGVDLHEIVPSAPGAVITKDDIQTFAADHSKATEPLEPEQKKSTPERKIAIPTTLPDFNQWGPTERLPFRSIRRATAARMSRSWTMIPHVHCQDVVDITLLEAFRQKHKDAVQSTGGRLTLTVFALKAVATALKNFPHFNSSLDLENQEIIVKQYFHIGVAVDSPKGLTVPVIFDVDRKSIKELSQEVHGAIQRVRAGKQTREEMQGGTFTITNAGALGGNTFSAIINHPEVAILGLGQGRMQATVVSEDRGRQEHKIVPRLIMPIVLCFDHRVVDGGDAIRFLRTIIDSLEDPDELLMTMI